MDLAKLSLTKQACRAGAGAWHSLAISFNANIPQFLLFLAAKQA